MHISYFIVLIKWNPVHPIDIPQTPATNKNTSNAQPPAASSPTSASVSQQFQAAPLPRKRRQKPKKASSEGRVLPLYTSQAKPKLWLYDRGQVHSYWNPFLLTNSGFPHVVIRRGIRVLKWHSVDSPVITAISTSPKTITAMVCPQDFCQGNPIGKHSPTKIKAGEQKERNFKAR